jgi:Asp/Glu/hydantoin racemase
MVDEREADAILLGCAGMVGLTEVIQKAVGQEVTVPSWRSATSFLPG